MSAIPGSLSILAGEFAERAPQLACCRTEIFAGQAKHDFIVDGRRRVMVL
jgi:hypothetical protein